MPRVPAAFEPAGPRPGGGPRSIRLWSIRHARGLSAVYRVFERFLLTVRPVAERSGLLARIEAPVTFVERNVKGALFDCRMCGKCILSSTGLSCPMNCPKGLRNGPCGGVRANGNCEVYAEMPCVWAKGWEGAQRVPGGVEAISAVQKPVDHRLKGRSSWMAVLRGEHKAGTP